MLFLFSWLIHASPQEEANSTPSGTITVSIPVGTCSAPLNILTASPIAIASNNSAYPCPAPLTELYDAGDGASYLLICNAFFYYNDLPARNTSTFAACIEACGAYIPSNSGTFAGQSCVAGTWELSNPSGANCYLKSSVQTVIYGSDQFDSFKLVTYNEPSGVSVSVLPSAATMTTSEITTPTTISFHQSASPCPYVNESIYTDSTGVEYQIECGIAYEYDDLPSVNVDSFANCMLACSSYTPTNPGTA